LPREYFRNKVSIITAGNYVNPLDAFKSFVEFYLKIGAAMAFNTMADAARMIPTSGVPTIEVAIREFQLNFPAQWALRADREHLAGVWPSSMGIVRRQLSVDQDRSRTPAMARTRWSSGPTALNE
jgi:hypothetical protein